MVSKFPNWGCGTPSKWPKSLINGGYELLTNLDCPPRKAPIEGKPAFNKKILQKENMRFPQTLLVLLGDGRILASYVFCLASVAFAPKKEISSSTLPRNNFQRFLLLVFREAMIFFR